MDTLVIDTNVVLDLFVFEDPGTAPLREALLAGGLGWIATAAMREELRRVLDYPQLARHLPPAGPDSVMAAFDRHARLLGEAPRCPFVCRDPDDQKFIDLAAAHGAGLLSKDAAVLSMARRLARLNVQVARAWVPSATGACA